MDLISDPCTKQCFGKRRVASDDVPGEITRSLDDPNPPPVVRNWVVQAARDEGRRPDGLTTDEKEEVRRLRQEVRVLRERAGDPPKSRGLVRQEDHVEPLAGFEFVKGYQADHATL